MDDMLPRPIPSSKERRTGDRASPVGDGVCLKSTDVMASGSGADTENPGPVSAERNKTAESHDGTGEKKLSQLGDYLLLKKLGSGAMGAVYKARRLSTKQDVALKVLFQHIAENPKLVERFHREAVVTKALRHTNIVRGFEAGEDHGFHYFAMEYVEGYSLQKWLARLGKISVGDALHIVLSCARALQHAHEKDVIHRDIKPDNILIARDGVVKIADLGMVKLLDEDMGLTQTGHAVGTPWYMPLEQAKNAKDTDGRCDIYALGCVFYACLTGHPPFTGRTLVDVIQAKEIGTFPPARQFNPDVPERLDLFLLKMTAKQPRYRYQNCAELIKDLEALGLANEAPSFLQAVNPAAASTPSTPVTPPPGPLCASTRTPFPVQNSDPATTLWYVRYRRADGKGVLQKLTTDQVLRLAEQPNFDPTNAQASREKTTGFRALATFKEFERVTLGRVSKTNADKQSLRSRRLMEKIVEKELQREEREERPVTTVDYWLSIAWRCGLVCLVVVLLYLSASWAVHHLQSIF